MPMAQELGLGITPWSPLKGGVLSGKHTRLSAGRVKVDRAAFVANFLKETTYTLIDELEIIAKAHDSTVARVALAWVRGRSGGGTMVNGVQAPPSGFGLEKNERPY